MNEFKEKYFPAILYYSIALAILPVMIFVNWRFKAPIRMVDSSGLFLIYIGIVIILWAFVYMRLAVFAFIEARRKELVQGGPYKYVRHPIYIGTLISLLGAGIVFRSWLGILCTIIIFLPAAIFRAKAEDKALARKFGARWLDYASKTGSLLPLTNKVRPKSGH
jgi:protein-S-isoprenylcysteine O-methyltransferase Ste14